MLPVRNRILLAAHVALDPNKPKAFRFGRVETITYDYVAPEYPEFLMLPPSRPRNVHATEAMALRPQGNNEADEEESDEDDSDEEAGLCFGRFFYGSFLPDKGALFIKNTARV